MAALWAELKESVLDSLRRAKDFKPQRGPLLRLLAVMGVAVLFSFLMYYLYGENVNASVIFTLAVIVVSCLTPGYFYSTMASVIGVLGVNYFFMRPYMGFNFTQTGYPITFVLLFFTSNITSTLMTIYRNQAERARKSERCTDALHRMTNELLDADEDAQVSRIVEKWIEIISGCPAHYINEAAEAAGREDRPGLVLLPVEVLGRPAGAFAVEMGEEQARDADMQNILPLFAAQYAMVREKQQIAQERNWVSLEMEAEKLRANLLRAVSHDLRTPLTSIFGATSALIDSGDALGRAERDQLYADIRDNAAWLIRMVENLLSVTRITQGVAAIHKSPQMAEEILAEAAGQVRRRFPEQVLAMKAPEELLIVPMDATLVEQVIINLIENAIYHAGPGPVEVEAIRAGEDAVFQVRDHGPGVDIAKIGQLFDGRMPQKQPTEDSHRGMGLGLSICATIIKAHGGRISAENVAEGGAIFRFTLPLEGTPQGAPDILQ